jgi:Ras-related protein Rab-18
MLDSTQILVLKILVAGEGNSGKTSLIRRFCYGDFDKHRAHTIGLDFYSKMLNHKDGPVKLSIWDLAGQPQFQSIREEFYKGAHATALVFDLNNPDSLHALPQWYQEIEKVCPGQKYLLIGNKHDLKKKVDQTTHQRFAQVIKAPYLETSAKNGYQVNKMFKYLAGLAISG